MSRVVLTACALSLLVFASVDARVDRQQATFSTTVEVVRVDVLVTDDDRPVSGLRPEDFTVLDNGVEQQVSLMSADKFPLNVTLALDVSESVVGDRLRHLQAASNGVLAGLAARDRAALVTFNENLSLSSAATADFAHVKETIEAIRPGGRTHLLDAMYAALIVGEAEGVRGLLIVFTDGNDTGSFLTHDGVVDIAKRGDMVVYAVAALSGAKGTPAFLKDVTRTTGGALFQIESTRNLSDVFARILDEFRHRYLLAYSPSGVSKGGWHQIEVRVKGHRGASVKARQGYYR